MSALQVMLLSFVGPLVVAVLALAWQRYRWIPPLPFFKGALFSHTMMGEDNNPEWGHKRHVIKASKEGRVDIILAKHGVTWTFSSRRTAEREVRRLNRWSGV